MIDRSKDHDNNKLEVDEDIESNDMGRFIDLKV